MTTLSCHQSLVFTSYISDIITSLAVSSSATLAFLTTVTEKCKSMSSSAFQVKICEIGRNKLTF